MSRYSVGTLASCLVFLLIAHIGAGFKSTCNPTQLEKCEKSLKMLGQKDGFQLVPQGTDLKVICRELHSTVVCLDDFVKDCVPDAEKSKMRLDKLLSGVKNFLKNVCDENSEMYRDYEKHGKCMATVSEEAADCTNNLKRTFDRNSQSTTESEDKKLEATCCALQLHFDCTRNAYLSKCGAGAARFTESSLKLIYGTIIEDKCNDEHGNPKCSSAFTVRPPAILLALVAIFWACQRKLW